MNEMKIALIVAAVVILAVILWRFVAVPRPKYPPLEIGDDDPEMKAALMKAQETVTELRQLYAQHPKGALVKVPFLTSSGKTEYLAAEVLEIAGDDIKVRLSTPPVSHEGQVERLQTYPLGRIVDWVVVLPGDKRRGGFTMKVMLKKGREQWGSLPAGILEEEKKYE
jgi:uncharacterized protein YegJ (DUF2314 family)